METSDVNEHSYLTGPRTVNGVEPNTRKTPPPRLVGVPMNKVRTMGSHPAPNKSQRRHSYSSSEGVEYTQGDINPYINHPDPDIIHPNYSSSVSNSVQGENDTIKPNVVVPRVQGPPVIGPKELPLPPGFKPRVPTALIEETKKNEVNDINNTGKFSFAGSEISGMKSEREDLERVERKIASIVADSINIEEQSDRPMNGMVESVKAPWIPGRKTPADDSRVIEEVYRPILEVEGNIETKKKEIKIPDLKSEVNKFKDRLAGVMYKYTCVESCCCNKIRPTGKLKKLIENQIRSENIKEALKNFRKIVNEKVENGKYSIICYQVVIFMYCHPNDDILLAISKAEFDNLLKAASAACTYCLSCCDLILKIPHSDSSDYIVNFTKIAAGFCLTKYTQLLYPNSENLILELKDNLKQYLSLFNEPHPYQRTLN
jgi:hypothetical protein